ncbi:9-cis-epoxycarotenoid dioxygenase [Sarracenia purpurea var. burkii]
MHSSSFSSTSTIAWCNSNKPIFKAVGQLSQLRKLLWPLTPSLSNTNSAFTKPTKPTKNRDAMLASFEGSLFTPFSSRNILVVASLFTTLSTKIKVMINPTLHPSVDPKFVLKGNFAPVDEMPPTEFLVVEGELPHSLDGVYIRNGPNPQHEPLGPHHLFEGDGMLHSVRLSRGHATFCSRYVKTYKYKLERDARVPMIPNFLSGFYGLVDVGHCVTAMVRALIGQISLTSGFGIANTSLSFFYNTIFAMAENDLPYAIRLTQEGDIETIRRFDFGGKAPPNMTAHPKIDAQMGEIFSFQCFPVFPYLTFFCFDADGSKQSKVPIFSLQSPSYIHDFAITNQYAVFPLTQLEMDPFNLMACKGMPVRSQPTKVPQIGVIPRYATSDSEMKWFMVPGFNALHIINAWEDDHGNIVIIATNALNIENFFHNMNKVHFSLEKLRINMKTHGIERTILSEKSLELGSINPKYAGRKNRYVYMAVGEHVPKMTGLVKIDLEFGCEVASRSHGRDCFGGEAFFVGRDATNDLECDEDDGFLVSYLHNEIANESQFVVMDAKSPSLDVMAIVKLPGRVPYGFHGIFLKERELQKQKCYLSRE